MKNIKYTIIIVALCMLISNAKAQSIDASAKLKEAQTAYEAHKLDDARLALQDAITAINIAIGKEIIAALPTKMNDMPYNEKDDNVSSAGGFAGLTVSRNYGSEKKNAKVVILGDSPLLTSINAVLAMPAFMTGSNPDQKRVKIGGYKGLLNKSTNSESKVVSYSIQVPVNQTLITIDVKGIDSENDAITIANTLPMDKIAKLAQ